MSEVTQSCLAFCDPRDHTVHGILQARILGWAVFPFSWESSQPRDWTRVSCIAGAFFTNWAIREALRVAKTFLKKKKNKVLGPSLLYIKSYYKSMVSNTVWYRYMCMLSHFTHVQFFVTPCTVAYEAPLFMGFCRQEYRSGLPFSSPGDLPNPGIEPASLVSPALAGRFFAIVPPGKHWYRYRDSHIDQWNWTKCPKVELHIYGNLTSRDGTANHQRKERLSSKWYIIVIYIGAGGGGRRTPISYLIQK